MLETYVWRWVLRLPNISIKFNSKVTSFSAELVLNLPHIYHCICKMHIFIYDVVVLNDPVIDNPVFFYLFVVLCVIIWMFFFLFSQIFGSNYLKFLERKEYIKSKTFKILISKLTSLYLLKSDSHHNSNCCHLKQRVSCNILRS